MSRPRGAQRTALGGFVSGGGEFTMRQLAGSLCCTIQEANWVLGRALAGGEVQRAGTKRIDGAKRPVALYKGTNVCTDNSDTPSLADAIQAWGR